jgi:glycosyltransferase involved in cell wall biosynthesis
VSFGHLPALDQKLRQQRLPFLMLLYETLEYDGRAQRMLSILRELGLVTIVDLGPKGKNGGDIAVDTRRVPVHLLTKNKLVKHIFFWLSIIQIAWREKPAVIVAENYFAIFPGWLGAKVARSRLVYDAYELIIPDPTYQMSKRDRLWYLLERWGVRRADLVIAANEERARLMMEHYSLKKMPLVIHNIPDSSNTTARKEDLLSRFPVLSRRRLDEVIILYQGDVSLSRGIDRFVRALAYLGPEYRMIIVGSGPDFEHLREIGRPFETEGRFAMIGRVEHTMLPSITAIADVGIISYPFQGLNNIYCAPNKLFEYAQAGLPVVATNQPPLRQFVEGYRIGELVGEHDSDEEVAKTIRRVAENKDQYKKGLICLLEAYRWENEKARSKEAIAALLGGKGGRSEP